MLDHCVFGAPTARFAVFDNGYRMVDDPEGEVRKICCRNSTGSTPGLLTSAGGAPSDAGITRKHGAPDQGAAGTSGGNCPAAA